MQRTPTGGLCSPPAQGLVMRHRQEGAHTRPAHGRAHGASNLLQDAPRQRQGAGNGQDVPPTHGAGRPPSSVRADPAERERQGPTACARGPCQNSGLKGRRPDFVPSASDDPQRARGATNKPPARELARSTVATNAPQQAVAAPPVVPSHTTTDLPFPLHGSGSCNRSPESSDGNRLF